LPSPPSDAVLESKRLEVSFEPVVVDGYRLRPTGEVAGAVDDEEVQRWNYGGNSDPTHISNRSNYHPGTRVVLDATPRLSRKLLKSKLGMSIHTRLVSGLRNRGYWPIRNCFENETRLNPDLGGKTQLRVKLDAQGNVIFSRLVSSTVRKKTVGHCIAKVVRTLRTDRPLGRTTEADLLISTWPGDLPLLGLPKGPVYASSRLTQLDRIIEANRNPIEACFENSRRLDSKVWGRLRLTFQLDELGKPYEVQESESHFHDPNAVKCISEILQSLTLETDLKNVRFAAAFRLPRPLEGTEETRTEKNAVPELDQTPIENRESPEDVP
jgi:hypothetical protein